MNFIITMYLKVKIDNYLIITIHIEKKIKKPYKCEHTLIS